MDDQMILDLRAEGRSLRQIGAALGISHVAVLKRLKGLGAADRVVTAERVGVIPEQTEKKESMPSGSKSRRSRGSEGLHGGGNQVVTLKAPSPISDNIITQRRKTHRNPHRGRETVLQHAGSEFDDLVGAIKGFLNVRGVRVYPIQVTPEAYQASHKDQVLRIYVSRRSESHEGTAGGGARRSIMKLGIEPRSHRAKGIVYSATNDCANQEGRGEGGGDSQGIN